MRSIALATIAFIGLGVATAQNNQDFSGSWRLNPARGEIHSLPEGPDQLLKVDQTPTAVTAAASGGEGSPARVWLYPLNGRTEKRKIGDAMTSTATKWEGAALVTNTIVNGPSGEYTIMDHWRRSRDGSTLTIERTISRQGNETDSVLIYQNANLVTRQDSRVPEEPATNPGPVAELRPRPSLGDGAEFQTPRPVPTLQRRPDNPPPARDFVVTAGTRILLRLTNSVNTKRSAPGDHVYLQTAAPVFVNGRLVIPVGSDVNGTIADAQPAGRVKGKSELSLQFDSLTLRTGVSRDLRSRAGSVEAKGNLDRSEGTIKGEGNKSGDAKTIGGATAAGAGIGAIARGASGAGIGAGIGALAGLAGVLGSRGPDVVLQPGTTMEMVLDRDLHFSDEELNRIY